MKISKKEMHLLIGVFGILIAFCAYQFCYLGAKEKIEEIRSENQKLESQISQYEEWLPNKETYIVETENMHQQITEWINHFPSNNLPEDNIKFAYQLDRIAGDEYMLINAMSFAETSMLYTTNYEGSAEEEETNYSYINTENLYEEYSLYENQVSFGISSTTNGMKRLVKNIIESNDKKSLNTISISKDSSTGKLTGTVTYSSYFIFGIDKPYSQPSLTNIRKGTDDIFITIPENSVEETEDATEE